MARSCVVAASASARPGDHGVSAAGLSLGAADQVEIPESVAGLAEQHGR